MKTVTFYGKKLQKLCSSSCRNLACFTKSFFLLISSLYRFLLRKSNPLWVQIGYFVSLSFFGFWVLKVLKPRTDSFAPRNLDLFFTSVSATTVSSMSTVEMEVFSTPQLVVLTILMFIGGEIFSSMLGLLFIRFKHTAHQDRIVSVNGSPQHPKPTDTIEQIELRVVTGEFIAVNNKTQHELSDESTHYTYPSNGLCHNTSLTAVNLGPNYLWCSSIKYLGFVILGYLLAVHVVGVGMVSLYLAVIPSAAEVLRNKGLKQSTFSVVTVVSTFASCGFVPTNENMVVFSQNSGLLLMLIPQVLLGNTLFPPCLRFFIWVWGKFFKKQESRFLLKKTEDVGYKHLLPRLSSIFLVATVFGFIMVQSILFCATDWDSEALQGLNSYQKMVGVIFQTTNSRHTGETIMDLSIVSPASLVLFVVMMYLPPYTSFLPIPVKEDMESQESCKRRRKTKALENFIFSQLSYLTIFIILVCITERKKLKQDPLNFNVFSIVLEVISAYGNVGFSMGYSCKRQLHPDGNCQDKWFGFAGKWSDEGKIILILVMLFGRLKKFNMDGGKAWKLL
ncbi:hypothetical protein L6164_006938 [Bauhinia variegata]|uniref:Uncharacterized protein n=1 Tax=Bauhinia variegata TaxID=167791 RepID=A0ACB9PVZ8_BAUVA|nr:hypothetical protein L6164_006938 [Bauhinia variegata]